MTHLEKLQKFFPNSNANLFDLENFIDISKLIYPFCDSTTEYYWRIFLFNANKNIYYDPIELLNFFVYKGFPQEKAQILTDKFYYESELISSYRDYLKENL